MKNQLFYLFDIFVDSIKIAPNIYVILFYLVILVCLMANQPPKG